MAGSNPSSGSPTKAIAELLYCLTKPYSPIQDLPALPTGQAGGRQEMALKKLKTPEV